MMLTLMVFLKDRSQFTERLCRYLDEVEYPYHVYFADGSIENDNEQYFDQSAHKFSYQYKRYPKDETLKDFYTKCYESLKDVKTPYVMLADNDDFPIFEGQEKAIDFLQENPSFIGCNGQVAGVTIFPKANEAYGKSVLFNKYYCKNMDSPVPLNQDFALSRIQSYLENFHSIFYSVFRTDSLQYTFFQIQQANFSDLGIHELFFSYMQLSQGKVHTINNITYLRQKGSSQGASSQKDWFHRLFYTDWLKDSQQAIKLIAKAIATYENKNITDCYTALYDRFVDRIRHRFIANDFYFLKNIKLFFNRYSVLNIFLNKLNLFFPAIAQELSLKFCNSQLQIDNILKIIQK